MKAGAQEWWVRAKVRVWSPFFSIKRGKACHKYISDPAILIAPHR
jgi:hypothetical protein